MFSMPVYYFNIAENLSLEVKELTYNDKQRNINILIVLNQEKSSLKNEQFKYEFNDENFYKVSSMIEKEFKDKNTTDNSFATLKEKLGIY